MKILKKLAVLGVLSTALIVTGCSDFERTSFQALSSSRDTINQAQDDYEAPATPEKPKKIPHNQCAYAVINDAKAAQTVAVNAMVVYEEQKATKQDLASQTALAATAVSGLAPLVVKVKTLYTNPAAACGGSK